MVAVMTKRGIPVALWAAAAVGVTAIATVVITASVGASGPTFSPEQVANALRTGGTTTTATRPATADPSVTTTDGVSGEQVFQTTPGTIVVHCAGAVATLGSWSPNPGYRVDEVVRGPADKVTVWFESDVADDVLVAATCTDGAASVEELPEFDDHGGNRGGSGSGSGSGGGGRDHPEDD